MSGRPTGPGTPPELPPGATRTRALDRLRRLVTAVAVPLVVAGPLAAAPDDGSRREALTTLRDECFGCHNESKRKGGLVLTSREALMQGGSEGPAVDEGDPAASRLLATLAADAEPHMPPKSQLDPARIDALRAWLSAGAPWDAQVLAEDSGSGEAVVLETPVAGPQPVFALGFSPDGNRLAFARGGTLHLYTLTATNLQPAATATIQTEPVTALDWSPDGRRIAAGGFRRVTLLDADDLTVARFWTNRITGSVTALAFHPDGRRLAVGDSDPGRHGYIRELDAVGDADTRAWRGHGDTVFDLEFSRDGTRLASAGGDRLVRIWNPEDGAQVSELEGHSAQVLGVSFSTNAVRVVTGGTDKALWVWDTATREKLVTLGRGRAAVTGVSWPGGAEALFAATDEGEVFRYTGLKTHTGEQSSATGEERRIAATSGTIHTLAVAASGQRIAVGTHAGEVTVWDADGKVIDRLSDPTPPAVAAVRTANGDPTAEVLPRVRRAARREPLPESLRERRVLSLVATPAEVALDPAHPRQGLRLTARTGDGFEVDVTDHAVYRVGRDAPVSVAPGGGLSAVGSGEGLVTARVAGLTVRIPVRVAPPDPGTDLRPSFVRDVLPELARAGCSAGACHAKAAGQNGFKLSVFAYDPAADHAAIVRDARARRVFPSAPENSLLLLKALGRMPHEGGRRFEAGSEPHRLIVDWIRAGMPYQTTNEPALERIEVFPRERTYRPGTRQRLLVTAHYADGSRRDVTGLSEFSSNDREMAETDADGRVTVGRLTGEAVVVARYLGRVDASRIVVPAETRFPPARYAELPRRNFIDELAQARFARLGLLPSDPVDDAGFLRRATLDTIGRLPSPDEVRAFLADPAPDKRDRWIERLLEDPAYADYWATRWADLLRPNPDRVGVKSVFVLDQWLREVFRANLPYDRFARDLLTAEGSNHRDGPAVVYRDRREPPDRTTLFSQLFLGVRLECARCHHHPNEKWSQDDFYRLAAYFGPVRQKGAGLSPPISAGTETFYFAPGGSVTHPVTGAVMTPTPPDAGTVPAPGDGDPRNALTDWLCQPDNPFFARAAVNRVWSAFFGRGLVEPVDDFRISNPCSHPALLDALAGHFVAGGYDFKALIRTILQSRLYQTGGVPNETNIADTRYFSRAYRRRLPAEVMLDAVNDAVMASESLPGTPPGTRAVTAWTYKIQSQFLDAFSRPNPSSDPPCERDAQLSVVQVLHLMNSRELQRKLADDDGRAARLAGSDRPPAEVVEELYLATLGRRPADDERETAVARFSSEGLTRRAATEDILWALLNSPEFLLNH